MRATLRAGLTVVTASYLLVMLALAAYLRSYSDASPLGMLMAFGPRWLLLVGWLPLLVAAWFLGRRLLLLIVPGALLTAFAVSGFEVPSLTAAPTRGRALRLVTYNTDREPAVTARIRGDLARWNADVVLFQDCAPALLDSLRAIRERTTRAVSEFCVSTSLPVARLDSLVIPGHRTRALRVVVRTPAGPLAVYSVHVESPRDALWAARHLDFGRLDESMTHRGGTSAAVRAWVRTDSLPLVVAGDFNLPTGSAILRRDWGDLTDAFSARGWGFGHSMFAGKFAVRIDHLFVPTTLVVEAVTQFGGYPSEHQPLLADLAWPR